MMFCPNCGKEVDNVKYCPYCGTDISQYTSTTNDSQGYEYYEPIDQNDNQQYQNNYNNNYYRDDDAPSMGFAVLSFFIPIVGLVLFIIWHKEYPLKAKSCLKGIIIGFVVEILLSCCLFSAIGGSMSNSSDPFDYYDTYDDYQDDGHIDFDNDWNV